MAKYIDVVAVRFSEAGNLYIYRAPWYSHLKKGMRVLCECGDGELMGTVECSMTCGVDSDELEFVKTLTDTAELPKIIAEFARSDMDYDDDEV